MHTKCILFSNTCVSLYYQISPSKAGRYYKVGVSYIQDQWCLLLILDSLWGTGMNVKNKKPLYIAILGFMASHFGLIVQILQPR